MCLAPATHPTIVTTVLTGQIQLMTLWAMFVQLVDSAVSLTGAFFFQVKFY